MSTLSTQATVGSHRYTCTYRLMLYRYLWSMGLVPEVSSNLDGGGTQGCAGQEMHRNNEKHTRRECQNRVGFQLCNVDAHGC